MESRSQVDRDLDHAVELFPDVSTMVEEILDQTLKQDRELQSNVGTGGPDSD